MIIVAFVFVAVFVVISLVLVAGSSRAGADSKQILANLNSALASYRPAASLQPVDIRKDQQLSAIPWVDALLSRMAIIPRLSTLLTQSDLKWRPGALLLMTAAAFVIPGALVYLRTEAVLFALIVAGICGAAPIAFVMFKRRQRFNAFEQRLPDALEMMVSALRAGHSFVAALRVVANESAEPVAGEFRICYDEQNYGLELRTAIDNMVNRVPLQDLKIVMTAVLIQKESGGNLAEVLEKASQIIRERFRLRRQVRTHTAQGRLTGWILSLLPIVLGMALYLVNPKTMSLLWTNPMGLKMLYTSIVMMIIGALTIRKIVNMEV